MYRLVLVLLVASGGALGSCGDEDDIEYRGTPGTPVAARFDSLIPDVAVRVDGHAEQRFLCDTGSAITFFDTTFFAGVSDGKTARPSRVSACRSSTSRPASTISIWRSG